MDLSELLVNHVKLMVHDCFVDHRLCTSTTVQCATQDCLGLFPHPTLQSLLGVELVGPLLVCLEGGLELRSAVE
jgi:hypothetical protein